MTTTWSPPICNAVGEFDDRPLRTKAASCQLVGRADAVNVLHPGKDFQIAGVEINPRANRGQHGLPLTGGAMYGKAHPDQVFDHLLDLLVRRCVLHGNNHKEAFSLQPSAVS